MTIINQYLNGNVSVALHSDGTKEREYSGIASPLYPESLDLKITNYCDAGCEYCHEQSVTTGKHGDVDFILDKLSELPAGVEIAIGGGDPLSHPDIERLLIGMRDIGLVPNMTVNHRHVGDIGSIADLVYGLGISVDGVIDLPDRDNVVVHMIAGVNTLSDLDRYLEMGATVLVLGYKEFGRGERYMADHGTVSRVVEWRNDIHSRLGVGHISFDNLAIRQLKINRFFTAKEWSQHYMGNDGQFTMYFDGVTQMYATSSVSPREPAIIPIRDWFQGNRMSIAA